MENVDFLIIGGGIAGCSLAYELARRNQSVALVERAKIGRATSTVNQGGIRQQFFQPHNIRAGVETVRRLRQFAEEFGVDPNFRQKGYLFLLTEPESVSAFERAVNLQSEFDVPSRMIRPADAAMIVRNLKVDDLVAACFCPTDGYADPAKVMEAYGSGMREAGVRVFEGTELVSFEGDDQRVVAAQTTAGKLGFGTIINAAGPWARHVARFVRGELPVFAHQSSIFMFQPEGQAYADIPLVIDIDRRVTLCPHREGVMVGDARKPRVDYPGQGASCDWTGLPEVRRRAAALLDDFATVPVARAWAGYWEVTPDDDPIIGNCFRDNFYVFAGFSGHGMSIVPGLAPSVAQELLGEETDISLSPFRLARFSSPNHAKTEIWGGTALADAEGLMPR